MSEISSGLVAVACMQLPGSANIERLCRLSDAEVEIERLSNLLRATEAHIEWNKLKSVIAAKDAEIESSRRTAEYWKASHLSGNELIEQQSAALKLAREALGEVQDLIGESHGVYGLHLNGDESPWNELEQGGEFERLTSLHEALAAIDSLLKGE